MCDSTSGAIVSCAHTHTHITLDKHTNVLVLLPFSVAAQHTHCYYYCCSFVQGVAAAQAGVSVIQPNVGRTRDWVS